MARFMSSRWLVPEGLAVEGLAGADGITVAARLSVSHATCPSCGGRSCRVHSRYTRTLQDLPCSGQALRVRVIVRRFRCMVPTCRARIFAERLDDRIATRFARRTTRSRPVDAPSRPGARWSSWCRACGPAADAGQPRHAASHAAPSRHSAPRYANGHRHRRLGVEAWAALRHADLRSAASPDRRSAARSSTRHAGCLAGGPPRIAIVAGDRGGGYGQAVTRVRPEALQVADRWHLMENASAAFLDVVRRMMTAIRRIVGTAVIDPALLTRAERIQYDGYLRRRQTDAAIMELAKSGLGIKAIVAAPDAAARRSGRSCAASGPTSFAAGRARSSPGLQQLDREWIAGCHNGAELWRRLQARGFRGSLRAVGEWATRRRRSEERHQVAWIGRPSAAKAGTPDDVGSEPARQGRCCSGRHDRERRCHPWSRRASWSSAFSR